MSNQPTFRLPPDTSASWLRCPKTSCDAYGKRLTLEVGQDDNGVQGLTVEHRCLDCGYAELGPTSPADARRTSSTLAALLRKQRLEGVEIPLLVDDSPWPEVADADA